MFKELISLLEPAKGLFEASSAAIFSGRARLSTFSNKRVWPQGRGLTGVFLIIIYTQGEQRITNNFVYETGFIRILASKFREKEFPTELQISHKMLKSFLVVFAPSSSPSPSPHQWPSCSYAALYSFCFLKVAHWRALPLCDKRFPSISSHHCWYFFTVIGISCIFYLFLYFFLAVLFNG